MAGKKLDLKKVEEMYDAYCESQTPNHVATVCGVARLTAKRYIEQGDIARSIEPFSIRLTRAYREGVRIKEKRVVYSSGAALAALQEQVKLLDDLIQLAAQQLKRTIRKQKVRLTDVAKAIEIRNQVILRMKPFDEREVEEEHTVEAFENRTAEELLYYAEHGCFPGEDPAFVQQALRSTEELASEEGDGEGDSTGPEQGTPDLGAEPDSEDF